MCSTFKRISQIFVFLSFIGLISCSSTHLHREIQEVYSSAPRSSFVKVIVSDEEGISTGSGVIIRHINNSNTIIMTAGHVCGFSAISISVLDINEEEHKIIAAIPAKDDDLCLMIVDGIIISKPIEISKEEPIIGDIVYNIAAPLGIHAPGMSLMFDGVYQGRVSLKNEHNLLDIFSTPGVGGSSGSPLFNDKWQLIAIVSRGIPSFNHLLMCVNYERTKEFYYYSQSDEFKNSVEIAIQDYDKLIIDAVDNIDIK